MSASSSFLAAAVLPGESNVESLLDNLANSQQEQKMDETTPLLCECLDLSLF